MLDIFAAKICFVIYHQNMNMNINIIINDKINDKKKMVSSVHVITHMVFTYKLEAGKEGILKNNLNI